MGDYPPFAGQKCPPFEGHFSKLIKFSYKDTTALKEVKPVHSSMSNTAKNIAFACTGSTADVTEEKRDRYPESMSRFNRHLFGL